MHNKFLGKEVWDDLPNLWSVENDCTLTHDTFLFSFINSYPHNYLKRNDGTPKSVYMKHGVKYTHSTKTYTRVIKLEAIE